MSQWCCCLNSLRPSCRLAVVVDEKSNDSDFAYYRPGVVSVSRADFAAVVAALLSNVTEIERRAAVGHQLFKARPFSATLAGCWIQSSLVRGCPGVL